MLTQFINAKVLTPQGWIEKGSVIIEDNKIVEVKGLSSFYSLDNLAKAVDDSIEGNVFKAYIEI